MPSTYTDSGIELIGDGEQSGAWGTTTNTNLQILDRLISQAGTISLSGTTHTLTVSDGALSDGQYAVLVFAGSPSGTNTVTVSPNDAKRNFIVRNLSGQTVVLTQGSGGNASVLNGRTALVCCDGGGAGAAVINLSDTFVTATVGAIGALTPTDGVFIVGNGSTWVTESGNTALTSLGVTATATQLNYVSDVTAPIQNQINTIVAGQLNITGAASTIATDNLTVNRAVVSDASGKIAVSAVTSTQLGYLSGVTSSIQTQLDGKQATITGAATTVDTENLTTGRALVSDGSGKIAVSAVTSTQLGYLSGVTSSIQTQIDNIISGQLTITGAASTVVTDDLTINRAVISNASGKIAVSPATSTELGYLSGVTSAIQTQLNGKQATITGAATTIDTENLTASRALVSDGSGKVAVSAVTSTELGLLSGKAIATAADYRAATADKILTADQVWSSGAVVALSDGATISLDLASGFNFSVTLGDNRTLANPTNPKVGQSGFIRVTQDGTGSRTLTLSSNYLTQGGAALTLSSAANAEDILYYTVLSPTEILINAAFGVS